MASSGKENKTKKKLAPLAKVAKKEVTAVNDDDYEFNEEMLAEMFEEDPTPKPGNTAGMDEPDKELDEIDLDDWMSPALKIQNSKPQSPVVPIKSSSTIINSSKPESEKTKINSAPLVLKEKHLPLNNRKELMFQSKEFEEDSHLGLRFSKRQVPPSKLKEMCGSSTKITLYDACKTTDLKNWFTFGVVSEYSKLRTGSGSRIDVTDLAAEPFTLRFLLFNTASEIGQIHVGSIVCISNPKKAKPYNGRDAMVVNDIGDILIVGMSKDFGLCSGRTKSGKSCPAVVNLFKCRYCRFHAVAEYKQQRMSKDLKAAACGVGLGVKPASAPGLWNASAKLAPSLTPARKNLSLLKKDKDRLDKLNTTPSSTSKCFTAKDSLSRTIPEYASSRSVSIMSKIESLSPVDLKRKCDVMETNQVNEMENKKLKFEVPDLKSPPTLPATKAPRISAAKRKALQFVREHGVIAKEKPKPQLKQSEAKEKKPVGITPEFLALMKEKPRDERLLKKAEAQEREKRFERLQVVEEISEKLAATHEVPVRAIRCLECKKNFHQMPLQCVMNKHKCKVVTGNKRFFECNGCRARTTTLERLPAAECSKCGVWSWKRAGVAVNRVCSAAAPLSLRGLEEKFFGSVANDPNLSLLVPENLES